jgi:sugar phosphate isomerase/epimerase
VHDNGGRKNDHLVPYAGTIPWDEAMMEMQKIGYDGAFIFELAPAADPVEVLKKAAKARERLEKTFVTF